jgi:hypothetical protein
MAWTKVIGGAKGLPSANSPAKNPSTVRQHAHRHPDPRRVVGALDDIIEVGTETQLEVQAVVDAPAILREEGELGAADLGVRR